MPPTPTEKDHARDHAAQMSSKDKEVKAAAHAFVAETEKFHVRLLRSAVRAPAPLPQG